MSSIDTYLFARPSPCSPEYYFIVMIKLYTNTNLESNYGLISVIIYPLYSLIEILYQTIPVYYKRV